MRALVVTNMYPTDRDPVAGTFVATQVSALRDMGIEVEVLVVDRMSSGRRSYFSVHSQVRDKLDGGFDVVHCRYGGILSAGTALAVKRRFPFVVSICGSDALGERELGFPHSASAEVGVLASRWASRRADHVIVMSRNLEERVSHWVPGHKISVIPDGVDLEKFQPGDQDDARRDLGWEPGVVHILFGGRMTPTKRPELARRAVAELQSTLRGPVELHFPEKVPHDAIPKMMVAADLLLFTSAHEGSPNMVREALACNVPVVSVDVGDVKERIAGVSACAIAEDDPAALAASMARTLAFVGECDGRSAVADVSSLRSAMAVAEVYEHVAQRG